MAADEANGLFGALPEERAAEAARGGRPRLRRAERGQVELRALSLDDLLPADHRARMVWTFAERLDLSPLCGAIKSVEGGPGHPPADPRVLMALWLYATAEGAGSARALARLCGEHVAYQWLCGGVSVNHKTLADFRTGHGALLERLLIDGFAALLASGVASLDRVAQDGMRVRANAGAASFRRRSTLETCRRAAEAEVARELEADPSGPERRARAAQARAARDRQARVEAAIQAAIQAADRLEAERAARTKRDGERGAGRDEDDPKDGAGGSGGGAAEAPAAHTSREAPEARASTTDPQGIRRRG